MKQIPSVIAVGALVAACAMGPAFVAPEPPRGGEAVVYVYRVSSLVGSGVKHAASIDGRAMGTLVNGSYMRIAIPTAQTFVDLRLAGCERLSQPLLLRPGDTFYVQAMLTNKTVTYGGKPYFDFGCVLNKRSESEALPAITGLPRAG